MKRVSLALGVLIATTGLFSCEGKKEDKFPGYEKVEEGLYIKYFNKAEGNKVVKAGDILTMGMKYGVNKVSTNPDSVATDSILFDSELMNQPVQFRADSSKYTGDFIGSLVGMREGDSASILVKADSFFLKTAGMPQLPPYVDSTTMLDFMISIRKVESEEEIQAAQAKLSAEAEQKEIADRQQYLADNNITQTPTESGLIFISKKKGTGKKAEAGKQVRVNYAGKFLDGRYFDTSMEDVAKAQDMYNPQRPYEPFKFTLGNREVIAGWDEAIAMMREGGKATLIIPSSIAYGSVSNPRSPIPAFSTLVFDVELVEVMD